jgi:hypothetical protein
MSKDFKALTYIADENVADTVTWLLHHKMFLILSILMC